MASYNSSNKLTVPDEHDALTDTVYALTVKNITKQKLGIFRTAAGPGRLEWLLAMLRLALIILSLRSD